ncbi:hypothetical protein JOB18_028121 [Solea senegalensis]|uniref:Uncharacterized protein n=1 Tax=Solea senegalensis TaxID=28829 RepID=A0AAV6SJM9_SOLSE|nr:hypothetical protein JOB18_028121 [Solea senegalensis]
MEAWASTQQQLTVKYRQLCVCVSDTAEWSLCGEVARCSEATFVARSGAKLHGRRRCRRSRITGFTHSFICSRGSIVVAVVRRNERRCCTEWNVVRRAEEDCSLVWTSHR